MTLDKLLSATMPQFPHLQKGGATSISLVRAGRGLNETIHMKHSEQSCHSICFSCGGGCCLSLLLQAEWGEGQPWAVNDKHTENWEGEGQSRVLGNTFYEELIRGLDGRLVAGSGLGPSLLGPDLAALLDQPDENLLKAQVRWDPGPQTKV